MTYGFKVGFLKWIGIGILVAAIGFGWPRAAKAEETATRESSPAPSFKLAVFPWRMVGIGSDLNDAVWKGLREAIQTDGVFSLTYSYYPTESGRETRMISRDLLNQSMERDLWVRKNAAEWYKPDVGLVSSVARQLKVDAVLMYSFDRDRHWITLQVFLVDVESGRVFDAKTMDSPSRPELLRAPVRGITLTVFREFQSIRMHGGEK